MRRLADWIGGAMWGVVAYRLFKRWRRPALASAPAAEETDDRAEELRAKLAAARASEGASEGAGEGASEGTGEEADPVEPGESAESIEERRRRVHEEGRAAIDRMNDPHD